MRKVLITGHKGFIGSHLKTLIPNSTGIDLKDGDDILMYLPKTKFTHIFHLAALRSVPAGESSPKDFIENNCWGTCKLMRTYPDARIINISSSSVNEPKSVYGATKAFAEMIGNMHKNCLNVRLYNVFGEGQPEISGAVVPKFIISKLRFLGTPTVYGDGSQKRDFTYVGDVVRNLRDLMFKSKKTGTIHLGYSSQMSVMDLLIRIYGHKPPYIQKEARSFDIRNSKSPSMMKIYFGREKGLRRTIKWYEDNYHGA